MNDILALLQCLDPYVTTTTLRQMKRIIIAMLTMTGRVTMLNISRWADKGGSYRTVQRFFHTAIPWALAFWLFFRQHLFSSAEGYLLAGDETIVTKSGIWVGSLLFEPVRATCTRFVILCAVID